MFARVAVVNRAQPAVRLIRAVPELNEERGYGIKVIAAHTEAEQRDLFLCSADESVVLRDVDSASSPHLEHEELERTLRLSRADAVWVGWGFVAEDPAYAGAANALAWSSSIHRRTPCGSSGTRSKPSSWPRTPACRWPRGVVDRCRAHRTQLDTPTPSGTRS